MRQPRVGVLVVPAVWAVVALLSAPRAGGSLPQEGVPCATSPTASAGLDPSLTPPGVAPSPTTETSAPDPTCEPTTEVEPEVVVDPPAAASPEPAAAQPVPPVHLPDPPALPPADLPDPSTTAPSSAPTQEVPAPAEQPQRPGVPAPEPLAGTHPFSFTYAVRQDGPSGRCRLVDRRERPQLVVICLDVETSLRASEHSLVLTGRASVGGLTTTYAMQVVDGTPEGTPDTVQITTATGYAVHVRITNGDLRVF